MRKETATPGRRHRMAVVVDENLSPFEFGVACDMFCFDRSQLGVPWYEATICAPTPGRVMTQVGFAIEVRHSLRAIDRADTVIVVPSGPPGPELLGALRRAHRRGARIASLCTAAFTLAEAGLLDGRRVTTHWAHARELAQRYPATEVDPRVLFIDDGDILTSAGSAASIDLCLHIMRIDFGAEVANAVARNLVVPPQRDGGQAQFVDDPVAPQVEGDTLGDTLAWAMEHLDGTLQVDVMASRAAMSPRTFARRFRAATGTTPKHWVLRQRVLLAQRLLETTDLGIDHVASASGLGTAANLRSHFDAIVGVAPAAYRRTFRCPAVA
jgi:transcriptional regulator GlxA family with amidase domain